MEKKRATRNANGVGRKRDTKDNAVIIIITYSEKELKKEERVFVFL